MDEDASLMPKTKRYQKRSMRSLIGSVPKKRKKKERKKEELNRDWDSLRREAQGRYCNEERSVKTFDSSDWEALRTADVTVVSETIEGRGCKH